MRPALNVDVLELEAAKLISGSHLLVQLEHDTARVPNHRHLFVRSLDYPSKLLSNAANNPLNVNLAGVWQTLAQYLPLLDVQAHQNANTDRYFSKGIASFHPADAASDRCALFQALENGKPLVLERAQAFSVSQPAFLTRQEIFSGLAMLPQHRIRADVGCSLAELHLFMDVHEYVHGLSQREFMAIGRLFSIPGQLKHLEVPPGRERLWQRLASLKNDEDPYLDYMNESVSDLAAGLSVLQKTGNRLGIRRLADARTHAKYAGLCPTYGTGPLLAYLADQADTLDLKDKPLGELHQMAVDIFLNQGLERDAYYQDALVTEYIFVRHCEAVVATAKDPSAMHQHIEKIRARFNLGHYEDPDGHQLTHIHPHGPYLTDYMCQPAAEVAERQRLAEDQFLQAGLRVQGYRNPQSHLHQHQTDVDYATETLAAVQFSQQLHPEYQGIEGMQHLLLLKQRYLAANDMQAGTMQYDVVADLIDAYGRRGMEQQQVQMYQKAAAISNEYWR